MSVNEVEAYRRKALKYRLLLEKEQIEHTKTKIKLQSTRREIHAITHSQSYKIAKVIALSKRFIVHGKARINDLSPKRFKLLTLNKINVGRAYKTVDFSAELGGKKSAELAVVVHLYYPDLADYFSERLKRLGDIRYDLYITIPNTKQDDVSTVRAIFPSAKIAIVPNCGRDVLPFVQLMKRISPLGYSYVLKLHSKKSPHRLDGDKWRDEIVGSLLPTSRKMYDAIIKKLKTKSTGIIGPSGQYVSFLVNFSSTGHHTAKIIQRMFGKTSADELVSAADEFGFFAGTMFWARVDAIMPVINSVNIVDFEPEMGQEDSTLAHGLERLLCVVPEMNNKAMYEVKSSKLTKTEYHTTNIPSWSDAALQD